MQWVRRLGRVGSEWCKLAQSMGYAEATPTLDIGVV
jgi:homoserine dehydrogenase